MKRIPGHELMCLIAAAVVSSIPCSSSQARPQYLSAWIVKYPTSTIPSRMAAITGSECNTCHHPPTRFTPGTCYRQDIATLLDGGASIEDALNALDTEDSDGDGVANGGEILTPRADQMGETGYHPGLIGATGTDPCGTDPAEVVSGQPETPPSATGVRRGTTAALQPVPKLTIQPNPAWNGQTRIIFELPEDQTIELAVFSVSGRKVRMLTAGRQRQAGVIQWDGRDETGRAVPAGIYFMRLTGAGLTPISEVAVVLR